MWKWPKCAGIWGTAAVTLKGSGEGKEEVFICLTASPAADAAHLGGELGLPKASYRPAVVGEFLSTEC